MAERVTLKNNVIGNILSNAIKFTEKGTIWIKAQKLNDMLKIAVEDTGVGMTYARLEELEANHQLSSQQGTSGERGTGLGLNVVYQLVGDWGGRVKVQSESQKGTRIDLYLPLNQVS